VQDSDLFTINYTLFTTIKEKDTELVVKWEIFQNFDVSSDNLCVATLDIYKQLD
jgi:hypothetical protein